MLTKVIYTLGIGILSLFLMSTCAAKTQLLYPLTSQEDQARFDQWINKTRCLVCKNQTIAESHTSLAQGLRKKIHTLIQQGYSNKDIQAYLANRYGDFILFEPSFKPATYVLWLTPLFFLMLALGYVGYVLYQRQKKAT